MATPPRPRLSAEATTVSPSPRRRPAQKTIALASKWFTIDRLLFADWAIENAGQYPADAPLFVGVTNLSDPSVQVRGAI